MTTSAVNSPVETIQIQLPKCDLAFLKKLATNMGWTLPAKKRTSSLDRSLEDLKNGRVTTYQSTEEFYKEMGI